jgi:hypothetical protein
MNVRSLGVAIVVSLAVAACGSTVRQTSGVAAGGTTDAGTVDAGAAAGAATPAATSTTGVSEGGTAGGTGATATTSGTTSGTTTGTVPQASTGAAKASSARKPVGKATVTKAKSSSSALAPVDVGLIYYPDLNQFNASFGVNRSYGDQKVIADAIVSWVNNHGGLNGHKINPILYALNTTDTTPYSTSLQAACDSWTQDHKAVAGITGGASPTTLQQCMNDRKAVVIQAGNYLHDATDYKRWPFMANPDEPEAIGSMDTYVEGLWQMGFFKPGDKIGVYYNDYQASTNAYEQGMVPALKRHGLKVDQYFVSHYPDSTPGLGGAIADIQGSILKMASAGINKVLFDCIGCAGVVVTLAKQQGWHPTYGMTTFDSLPTKDVSEMKGAMAVGWSPIADSTQYTRNATGNLCMNMVKDSGQVNNQATEITAYVYCSSLLMLQAAAKANPTAVITGDSLRIGIEKLGSSFLSPASFSALLAPGHRAGITTAKGLKFEDACQCFKYTDVTLRF